MDETKLEIEPSPGRLSVSGPALAVIALLAVCGIIYIAARVLNLAERAIAPGANLPTTQVYTSHAGREGP